MHILFFLAVATVLIIWWFHGNLFACVFLSLPVGAAFFAGLAMLGDKDIPVAGGVLLATVSASVLVGIWAPRYYRGRRDLPVLNIVPHRDVADAQFLPPPGA
jgi:uncharacterized membrane protein (UPF0136 family)